jgi:hypothetical protein
MGFKVRAEYDFVPFGFFGHQLNILQAFGFVQHQCWTNAFHLIFTLLDDKGKKNTG